MVFTFGSQKKAGFLLSLIIIFFISSSSLADRVTQPIQAKKLVPACFLAWNSGPEFAVLVDKSRQKVFVYKRDDLYNPYRVYDCSTGENDGRKQKRNDRKTPEGLYYFIKSIPYWPIISGKDLVRSWMALVGILPLMRRIFSKWSVNKKSRIN